MLYFNSDSMKKLKIIIITFLIMALLPLFINLYVIFRNISDIKDINEVNSKYDIALILGCSIKNNKPSKMLRDRLNKGIELYNKGLVKKILISGDHESYYSEVDVMYTYLIENDINDEDILIDRIGYSTSESLLNYKENYSDQSVIIVTQKYHLFRALNIAKDLKLTSVGVHADLITYKGFVFREIREILARNKDFFKLLILK